MTFAEALRNAITAQGVTPYVVGKALGWPEGAIYSYLHGRIPSIARADALAEHLDSRELRRLSMSTYRSRCARCNRYYHSDPRTISQRRFCGGTCRTLAYRDRIRPGRRTNIGKRLATAQKAIAAFCRSCEPMGLCRDSACALRSVSPLPFVPMSLVTRRMKVA